MARSTINVGDKTKEKLQYLKSIYSIELGVSKVTQEVATEKAISELYDLKFKKHGKQD
jgi:hypothetical protein